MSQTKLPFIQHLPETAIRTWESAASVDAGVPTTALSQQRNVLFCYSKWYQRGRNVDHQVLAINLRTSLVASFYRNATPSSRQGMRQSTLYFTFTDVHRYSTTDSERKRHVFDSCGWRQHLTLSNPLRHRTLDWYRHRRGSVITLQLWYVLWKRILIKPIFFLHNKKLCLLGTC